MEDEAAQKAAERAKEIQVCLLLPRSQPLAIRWGCVQANRIRVQERQLVVLLLPQLSLELPQQRRELGLSRPSRHAPLYAVGVALSVPWGPSNVWTRQATSHKRLISEIS